MFIGYIYKITGACGGVYIGSTVNFKNRIKEHNSKKSTCSSRYLEKPLLFKIIRQDEYILVKTMRLVEQYYMDNTNCVNVLRAYTKLNQKKYNKNYRETHKEKMKQYKKDYYINIASIKIECIYCKTPIMRCNMSHHHKTKRCLAIQKSLNTS